MSGHRATRSSTLPEVTGLCEKDIRYLDPKPPSGGAPSPPLAGILAPCTKPKGHGGRCANRGQTCGEVGPVVDGEAVLCERHLDSAHHATDGPIHANAHRATGGSDGRAWTLEWSEV